MVLLNDELFAAYVKAADCRRANMLLGGLRQDAEALRVRLTELKAAQEKEEADAEKLEAGGAAVALSRLMGTHQERLEGARKERYDARRRCEEALLALTRMEEYMARAEAACASLEGSEAAYQVLLERKTQEILGGGGQTGQRYAELTEAMEDARENLLAAEEAQEAGACVAEWLRNAYSELDEADDYSGRGGMLVRWGAIETAEDAVTQARGLLERFNGKLSRVRAVPRLWCGKHDVPCFAEVSIGGLIPGRFSMDRLGRSQENIEKAQADVQAVLSRLKDRAQSETERLRLLEEERLLLVLGA